MTTRHTMKWLLVVLLAAACTGNDRKSDDALTATTPDTPPPPSTSMDVQTPAPAPGLAELRMRGVLNPGYSALDLSIADVKVWVDGEAVDVDDVAAAPLDLTNADHAWLLGRFALPAPGKAVKVKLVLDDYGSFEGMGAGDIDARGLPIEFTVPSDWFQPRRHAVVHLDLTRSVVGDGETRVLLPQLQLFF